MIETLDPECLHDYEQHTVNTAAVMHMQSYDDADLKLLEGLGRCFICMLKVEGAAEL